MGTLTERLNITIPPEERPPLEGLAQLLGTSKGRIVRPKVGGLD
jgi:hypothetical protein